VYHRAKMLFWRSAKPNPIILPLQNENNFFENNTIIHFMMQLGITAT